MAKVKRGFLIYDSRREKPSVSWQETLSLVADGILLQKLFDVKGNAKGRMLDVGCGAKPYSSLFSPLVEEYIGIDLPSTSHGVNQIDVYANAMALPLKSNSFDTVLCSEVLEHVPEPQCLVHELWRVLKINGFLLLSTPQNYWVHEAPNDFYRFTRYGLIHLMQAAEFQVISVVPMGGVIGCLVDTLSKAAIILVGGLDMLLGRLLGRSRTNLISFAPVRLLIAMPQWAYLFVFFGLSNLANKDGRPGLVGKFLEHNSERFTLGHVVVAVKR